MDSWLFRSQIKRIRRRLWVARKILFQRGNNHTDAYQIRDGLIMSMHLLEEVRQLLPELEATQSEFADLFVNKRQALVAARSAELLRIADSEAELANRLQAHLGRRQKILLQAKRAGLPSDSIVELVARIAGDLREQLELQIERIRDAANSLRRESWIQWIIAHRTCSQYSEIKNLIAHCGEKDPIYSRDTNKEQNFSGGAILDASI